MGKTVFDYSELLGKIKARGFTQETLAKHIGMANSSMSLKLNNKAYFRFLEMVAICEALGIALCNIGSYFFVEKVRKDEQEKADGGMHYGGE